jgi:hypothetical protein
MVGYSQSKSSSGGLSITRQQRDALRRLVPNLETAYAESPGLDYFPGASQGTLQSLSSLEELSKGFNTQGGVGDVGKSARGALLSIIGGPGSDRTQGNAYFKSAVTDPLLETFTEDVIPGINRANLRSGFYGSQRVDQQTLANEQLTEEIARARAAMLLEGVGLANQGAGAIDVRDAASIAQASDQGRQIEMEQKQAVLEERARRVDELMQLILGQTRYATSKGSSYGGSVLGG